MERPSDFDTRIKSVRSITQSALFTPRVDSYHEQRNHILCYDVELPGVQRENLKVVLGYSPIFKQKSITIWGVSLSPLWPFVTSPLEDVHSSSTSSLALTTSPVVDNRLPFKLVPTPSGSLVTSPIVGGISSPIQRTMERIHGEFCRRLLVPPQTQPSDIVIHLEHGILSIAIKCDKPLTANELLAIQEVLEVH
ncbi:hypothetical protein C8J55DRAFT_556854 [Lentinula edodes]|uniref:SHSP domain-containing protein n=1 Tax=Lentinula lateritia TaxID=40482 RepID=A0A9W9DZ60_9AGAR|nr:hypothetical protein F5877DRAFT_81822 [Lentinula edodes]KAJ4491279.1 hypothetical protein C8J55DRAFT_556854 [Lentinula edodes]